MDARRRSQFNAIYSEQLFRHYMNRLESQLGSFPFRVAETPLFMTPELRDLLAKNASEIVAQLSEPRRLTALKKAIPAHYDMPGMDPLPNCVQVDFAITQGPQGQFEGKVVELQAFPSLYALMTQMGAAWGEELNGHESTRGNWSCIIGDRQQGIDLMARTILGGEKPEDVVLVDYEPEKQKTSPDFTATQKMFGVDSVCVTKLTKKGRQLFREKGGRQIRVKRIYNRMVFDELEVKGIKAPFEWTDDLDLTWCSHPNWYWVWSKYALPFIDHPAVPKARFVSDIKEMPADLSRYVLKPLFSFAGTGVVVDVTQESVDNVPVNQRDKWVLQEKIEYAPAIKMPDGAGVKVEVRMMLLRPPEAPKLTPLICLVRLSRGKMIGVDHNKDMAWTGGSVGIWDR